MKKKKVWFGWAVVQKNGRLIDMSQLEEECIVTTCRGIAKDNLKFPEDSERLIRVRITEVR